MSRNSTNAFTLVELLVVIAIISILAALMMPALKGARESAKSIQCMSNLRQMHLGMMAYVNDNDGFLPAWYDATTGLYWCQVISDPGSNPNPWENSKYLGAHWWRNGVGYCASTGNVTWPPGHAYNIMLSEIQGGGWSSWLESKPVRMSLFDQRAQTILFIDGRYGMAIELRWGSTKFDVAFSHKGRANAVFLDGHVETRASADIPTSSSDWAKTIWSGW